MQAKLGESTGAKFHGKDVTTVRLPDNMEAQPGQVFGIDDKRYVLLQEVGKDPDVTFTIGDVTVGSVMFLCFEAPTPEEEWNIKRKMIARGTPHPFSRR
jgi:hypothetical protein